MTAVAYVNGRFLRRSQPAILIEDRGLQFADGVYEVWGVFAKRLVDFDAHLRRLERSLSAIQMEWPMPKSSLGAVIEETRRRNRIAEGLVYLQVTRGVAPRDHAFPSSARSSLIVTARSLDRKAWFARASRGVAVITVRDERWARCDIKSTALLPNVLAKEAARRDGAVEAWLLDEDGTVTEGASSTAWIVTRAGVLVTRPLGADILPGITRERLLELAAGAAIPVEQRSFTPAEAQQASEAFISSASALVLPVVRVDGRTVGEGAPGQIATRLLSRYLAEIGL
jgi:D-alanine transaminase